jgi:hypothetical protein
MRSGALLSLLATVALLAACGGSDEPEPSASPPSAPPAATSPPTTTPALEPEPADPLEGADTAPVSAEGDATATSLLSRVAIARHEAIDRVVFQFRDRLPGYRVEYTEPPLYEDGSGDRVDVAGNAFVVVRMERASGFDLETADGELVYTGPRRLTGDEAGTATVREVVRTGDFEAVLTWAVGLSERVDFRVLTLDDPARLVIDFRNA